MRTFAAVIWALYGVPIVSINCEMNRAQIAAVGFSAVVAVVLIVIGLLEDNDDGDIYESRDSGETANVEIGTYSGKGRTYPTNQNLEFTERGTFEGY